MIWVLVQMAVLLDQTHFYAALEHAVVVLRSLDDVIFYNNMVLDIPNIEGLGSTTNDLVMMVVELVDLGHNSADTAYNKRLVALVR